MSVDIVVFLLIVLFIVLIGDDSSRRRMAASIGMIFWINRVDSFFMFDLY